MIGVYIECLREMTEFCERRGFRHSDFPALTEIIEGFNVLEDPVITLTKIKKIVANTSGLVYHELDKKSQEHKYLLPRQLGHYYGWLLTDETLEKIGRIIGKRDYSTVLHSRKRIQLLRETKYPREDYERLKELDVIFAPYREKKKAQVRNGQEL